MSHSITYGVYHSFQEIAEFEFEAHSVFLSKTYFEALGKSAPKNMTCHFILLFQNQKVVGVALAQFLNLNQLASFGERDKCLKALVRNFIFKNFSSHVLFIGNNMLSGQNAFWLSPNIAKNTGITLIKNACLDIVAFYKTKGIKIHVTTFKDFEKDDLIHFSDSYFLKSYCFSTQPNMQFSILENWNKEDDYVLALSKKYRDQYKRSRKKCADVVKKKLHLNDIIQHEKKLYELYFFVAKNAPFNTFFLQENHFEILKKQLHDSFLVYGYFLNDDLIGFNTLIKNGTVMETYFLGYDDTYQKEKMLYLNMLYDMVGYSIKKGFSKIVFGRTALEIKSSVGAEPTQMFGFITHSNKIINYFMPKLFPYFDPKINWTKRNPYK